MSDTAPAQDTAPPRFAFRIDRSLAVPVGVQLRGQIEYGVACGEIPRGAQMPSVRELSQDLGLAHVTVAGVYKELGQKGLLTTHPGRGTFVADGQGTPGRDLAALHRAVDRLLAEAGRLGFTPEEVALIAKDARLTQAVKACPWQLRQALDAWDDIRSGARPQPIEAEPCRVPADDGMGGRASDEAALDILKILKEAAGQGTAR